MCLCIVVCGIQCCLTSYRQLRMDSYAVFMNGWSAAVYSRTVSNVLGNVSRVLRWSTRKTDIIEFIFDTLVGLGITNYFKR